MRYIDKTCNLNTKSKLNHKNLNLQINSLQAKYFFIHLNVPRYKYIKYISFCNIFFYLNLLLATKFHFFLNFYIFKYLIFHKIFKSMIIKYIFFFQFNKYFRQTGLHPKYEMDFKCYKYFPMTQNN